MLTYAGLDTTYSNFDNWFLPNSLKAFNLSIVRYNICMTKRRDFGNPIISDDNSLLDLLPEFRDVWNQRPIEINFGGMTFNHSFGVFAIARILNLPNIIESGVWKGHSSYILRKACPQANIISLDVDFRNLVYVDESIKYLSKDFGHIDWSSINQSETLCFFDDHISALQRLYEMKWWGFRYAIFEDNWPAGEGDSYSLRHIIDNWAYDNLEKFSNKKNFNFKLILKRIIFQPVLNRYYYHQHLFRRKENADSASLLKNLNSYWEFPPVVRYIHNNWGGNWNFPYDAKEGLLELNADSFLTRLELDEPNRAFHYGYLALITI